MGTGLRVGFDARWYNNSGIGTYVYGLARTLTNWAPDVDLVLYQYEHNPLPPLESPCESRTVTRPRYSVSGQFEMAVRCKRDKLDVFHSPFYPIPYLVDCPVVVTIHDLMPFLFPLCSLPKDWIVKAGYRTSARRAAQIIAMSRNTASDIDRVLNIPAERISVIYPGVLPIFTPRANASEEHYLRETYGVRTPYVLTLSFRNWHTKNIAVALQGMKIARAMGAQFQAVVAGVTDGLVNCQRVRDALQPVVTGFVPLPDLAMLYRNASVFISASDYEGFGFPVLEAMASGCAVISSSGGSLPEVAGQAAMLVPTRNPHAIADAIHLLLSDEEMRRCYQNRGIRRALQFSWREAALRTRTVYEMAAGTVMAQPAPTPQAEAEVAHCD